jgi:PTH1 family peptidyl-tRNA hydrolase
MKLVIGLGNPGRRYAKTRHNVGFDVLAELARRHGVLASHRKFDAEISETVVAGAKVVLAAPQTYMNASGRCVRQIVGFYQLPLAELLIVSDDLNLRLGQVRLRGSGSAGGQKGLGDIIQQLGSNQFARLRVGIDRPPECMDAASFVLSRFSGDERERIDAAIQTAANGVELWIESGLEAAMNKTNAPSGP